jgi:hypothetical protein
MVDCYVYCLLPLQQQKGKKGKKNHIKKESENKEKTTTKTINLVGSTRSTAGKHVLQYNFILILLHRGYIYVRNREKLLNNSKAFNYPLGINEK